MIKNLSIELVGLGKALLASVLLSLLATLLVYYTGLSENLFAPLGNIIMVISIFWGACHVSKVHGSKGLLRGINMGVAFFILMFIATLVFNPALISMKTFLFTLMLSLIAGGLGGILGVGLSNNI